MIQTGSDKIELYNVDFTNYRLSDLIDLANQARPFYEWIECQFQREMHLGDSLDQLIRKMSLEELRSAISSCYDAPESSSLPKLFDGGGVPYSHYSACYFMFAWMARDAATQRLRPLIGQAHRSTGVKTKEVEVEALANLIFKYRNDLRYFDWPVVREIVMQRLEGSRRAKKGSACENYLRSSLAQAFSFYYQTHGDYGKYKDFEISPKPIKVNNRTYDGAVKLIYPNGKTRWLIIPVKTRETEGGGHAHLFTRDVEQANIDILETYPDAIIAFMIIAQNWSGDEIEMLREKYDAVFYFQVNPAEFLGFGSQQSEMNIFIESVLDNEI